MSKMKKEIISKLNKNFEDYVNEEVLNTVKELNSQIKGVSNEI
jgi:hypothetical protein